MKISQVFIFSETQLFVLICLPAAFAASNFQMVKIKASFHVVNQATRTLVFYPAKYKVSGKLSTVLLCSTLTKQGFLDQIPKTKFNNRFHAPSLLI